MKNLFALLIVFATINFINSCPEEVLFSAQGTVEQFSICINRTFQELFTISENLESIFVEQKKFKLHDFFSREEACSLIVEKITVHFTLNKIETLNNTRMQILQIWHKLATDENLPKAIFNAYSFLNIHLHSAFCLAYDIIENKSVPKGVCFLR